MLAWLRRARPDPAFEARVRRELAAADSIEPDPGALTRIRARTRKGEPWPSPQSQPSGPGSTHGRA